MTSIKIYFTILTAFVFAALVACKDNWEEHTTQQFAALNENLMQPIQANQQLSKFAEYLKQTGYDELLNSSKLFTVWAPTNEALAALDPAVVSNPEKLKLFVANHISYQQYYSYTGNDIQRVKAVNGKNLSWDRSASKIEGAAFQKADQQYKNGVLHIITQAMLPKMNAWEYLNSLTLETKQKNYINTKSFESFDPALAEQTGIDPNTGAPIYKPGTGIVWRNSYLEQVRNIMHEDSLSTFIILTDEAFTQEYDKISKFYATSTEDSTRELTTWHVLKDLAIEGLYTPENLPDTLVSRFGVKVPMNEDAIVATYRTSNGIVYVMNKVDFRVKHKIPTIIVEGESAVRPDDFTRPFNDRIHYRYRDYASNQHDLRVYGHGWRNGDFWVRYRVNNLPAGTYKLYMRATKDYGTNALRQRVALDSLNSTSFAYQTIPMNHLDDVYVGEFTVDRWGYRTMYVVCNPDRNNDWDKTSIVVDYLKLVPVY